MESNRRFFTTYGAEFNSKFPIIDNVNNKRAYAGCYPVAAGQVMYYHRWPNTYDWDAMDRVFATHACAQLLFDIAEESDADYSINGTGVSTGNMVKTFRQMGYTAESGGFNNAKIMSNNTRRLPVLINSKMKSASEDGYHAWIIAGWKQYYSNTDLEIWGFADYRTFNIMGWQNLGSYEGTPQYYCNWGKGGRLNGWYLNSATICPNGYTDNIYEDAIYEIKPNK